MKLVSNDPKSPVLLNQNEEAGVPRPGLTVMQPEDTTWPGLQREELTVLLRTDLQDNLNAGAEISARLRTVLTGTIAKNPTQKVAQRDRTVFRLSLILIHASSAVRSEALAVTLQPPWEVLGAICWGTR
jgi:hypothetical protein